MNTFFSFLFEEEPRGKKKRWRKGKRGKKEIVVLSVFFPPKSSYFIARAKESLKKLGNERKKAKEPFVDLCGLNETFDLVLHRW